MDEKILADLIDVDRIVHDPVRLGILLILREVEDAEFRFIERRLNLSRGNLSSHATKLKEVGYIEIKKFFRGNQPVTQFKITCKGEQSLANYIAKFSHVIYSQEV